MSGLPRTLVWQVPLGGLGNAAPTGIEQRLSPDTRGKIAKSRFEARATRTTWCWRHDTQGLATPSLMFVVALFPELAQPEATITPTNTATAAVSARIPTRNTAPKADASQERQRSPGPVFRNDPERVGWNQVSVG
jgi:hypothetical protein